MWLWLVLLIGAISVPSFGQGGIVVPPGSSRGPVNIPSALACAPSNAEIAAALVGNAIWVTLDGGLSWSHSTQIPPVQLADSSVTETANALPEDSFSATETADAETPFQPALKRPYDPGPESSTPTVHLAVSDTGQWALYRSPLLLIGRDKELLTRRKIGALRGFFFDHLDRLWLVQPQGITVLSNSHERLRHFATIGAGAPARGRTSGEYLVPTPQGVLRILTPMLKVIPLAFRVLRADAVGAHPTLELLYVARAGSLELFDGRGNPTTMARLPGVARRIIVDKNGFVWISLKGTGAWFRWENGRWHAEPREILARDILGNLWRGTEWGPDRSEDSPGDDRNRPPQEKPFLFRSWTVSDPSMGPPPCPSGKAVLSTQVGFFLFLRSGNLLSQKRTDLMSRRGQGELCYSIGLKITLGLQSRPVVECSREKRVWAEMRLSRWRNAAAAVKRLERSPQGTILSENPLTEALLKTEQDYLRHSFRLFGGHFEEGGDENTNDSARIIDDCITETDAGT